MEEQKNAHRLSLEGREHLMLWGVTRVAQFAPEQVILETEGGLLRIRGSEMSLRTLSLEGGKMELTGRVDGLEYAQSRRGGR